MALDHSATYRKRSFRNTVHRFRLKQIFNILEHENKRNSFSGKSYIDIGCSNGYITELIRQKFNLDKTVGADHKIDNLEVGKNKYDNIEFREIDLNSEIASEDSFNLVTCFETLEHVGDLNNAITNVVKSAHPNGGFVLISVPIEIQLVGIIKFIIKTILFNYKLDELPGEISRLQYFISLMKNEDISVFRTSSRAGWGTHFGFDFRKIDRLLSQKNISYKAFNKFTTRFYLISV